MGSNSEPECDHTVAAEAANLVPGMADLTQLPAFQSDSSKDASKEPLENDTAAKESGDSIPPSSVIVTGNLQEPPRPTTPEESPGNKDWTDQPPPALIEKISLTDETERPPLLDGQPHERPSSEPSLVSETRHIPSSSSREDLSSGVTKATAAVPLAADTKQLEQETVNIHGKLPTDTTPASSSEANTNIVSTTTSLPALSRIVMPYSLANDAGRRPLSPPATLMASRNPRPITLSTSPFSRPDILHPTPQLHRPSVSRGIEPSIVSHPLPPPSSFASRPRSRSPSAARSPALSDSSDSSSNNLPPLIMDANSSGSHAATGPPLLDTDVIHKVVTGDGLLIRPEIHARIDKGFFLSDNDWTCYRRNYFSVGCSYSLYPPPNTAMYLQRHLSGAEQVTGFAVKISAAVEGAGGKPVELVQHTPKRDKGPQMQPAFIKLVPQSSNSTQLGGGSLPSSLLRHGAEYEYNYPHPIPHQQMNQAVYDRIQFKSATANNGKRRAAQQYYHLIVELYAEVLGPGGDAEGSSYVLVAKRVSAPMVVRGRSPGHYVDERKHRPASAGPDGRGSGTQPSTPATAYAPPNCYPKVGSDQDQYISSMTEGEPATYSYYPQALAPQYDSRSSGHTAYAGYYISGGVHDTYRGYQPVGISCSTYGDSTYGYVPSTSRSRVKQEGAYNSFAWPREAPRVEYQSRSNLQDKLYSTESSSQHYPTLPTL